MTTNSNEINENMLQLVSFKLGAEEFGIDIMNVHEILKIVKITSVPNAPQFVEGIIELRDKVIPVLDLRLKLNLDKREINNFTRIIVTEINGVSAGFIVDSVDEVLRISQNISEPPPELVRGVDSEFISVVCKLENRLILLLDFNKILSISEIESLQNM